MKNNMSNVIKRIQLKDIFAVLKLIILLPIVFIFRLYLKIIKKNIWLICESKNTASDNGYQLFKYIKDNKSSNNVYYVIDKSCYDYQKVKEYGNIIEWGSLKHWIFYLSAKYNISSQKAGNPNAALFYLIHVKLKLYKNRIFLQHGIIYNNLTWLYYKDTYFKKFISGAKREYEYLKTNFGYPEGTIEYTGLARYDNLYEFKTDKKQILIIPTWREWLGQDKNKLAKVEKFTDTTYFVYWSKLLSNRKLIKYIEKNDITVNFYPHINMQKFINYFKITSKNIKIIGKNTTDIQSLLKTSSLMVTDYSSVFFDFAYMKKPIIYYQFDLEEFRCKQYEEGYFSYENDGFGKVEKNTDNVVEDIIKYIESNYKVEEIYKKRMDSFFERHDTNNCERIYNVIETIEK